MQIYLDNASTTRLDERVLACMLPYLRGTTGNPSSVHRWGNKAKVAIERSRKKIAELFKVAPAEIMFTSGGTEGNNFTLWGAIDGMQIQHVLVSPLEHLSVYMPLEQLVQAGKIKRDYIPINEQGVLELDFIEKWLKNHPNGLVSAMCVNHELGNITDIQTIAHLCTYHKAFFHTDMVQSLYCYPEPFNVYGMHLAVASAHKIHGPPGIGFVYIDPKVTVTPLIYGGQQELNRRAGTENVASIVGLASAIELVFKNQAEVYTYLTSIKQYMIDLLRQQIPDVIFNGQSGVTDRSSPILLNISLPSCKHPDMLVYNLDLHGIAASTGSACTSGSLSTSRVLSALQKENEHAIRFSFSKYTTKQEIEKVVTILLNLCQFS